MCEKHHRALHSTIRLYIRSRDLTHPPRESAASVTNVAHSQGEGRNLKGLRITVRTLQP